MTGSRAAEKLARGEGRCPDVFEMAMRVMARWRLRRASSGALYIASTGIWTAISRQDLEAMVYDVTGWASSAERDEVRKLVEVMVHDAAGAWGRGADGETVPARCAANLASRTVGAA